MSASTTFQTTAKADKAAYNAGDKITLSITGGATGPDTTSNMVATLTLTAADGSTGTANVTVPVTKPGGAESVAITKVVDDGGRTWTIVSGGQSATATA